MSSDLGLTTATVCLAVVTLALAYIVYVRAWQNHKHHVDFQADSLSNSFRNHATTSRIGLNSWLCRSLPLFGLLGFLSSCISSALLQTHVAAWLTTISWVFTFIQTLALTHERKQPIRYSIALGISLSGVLLCLAHVALFLQKPANATTPPLHLALISLAITSGLCLSGIPIWCIPRREDVYWKGVLVDRLFACSMLDRLSFAWVRPLLDRARTTATLEFSDLSALDHPNRSATLLKEHYAHAWRRSSRVTPLWLSVFQEHYASILRQWALGIAKSILMITPPLCLYQILAILEARSSGNHTVGPELIQWIIALGASKLAYAILGVWTDFAAFPLCAVRIRSQLSGLVFQKALRGKIIAEEGSPATKGNSKVSTEQEPNNRSLSEDTLPNEVTPLLTDDVDEADALPPSPSQDSAEKPPLRGVTTLMAVDVRRVEGFTRYSVELWQGIVEVILATAFLVKLLGWWSTLAALTMPLLLYPLNRLCFDKYIQIQDTVMKIRDRKQHAISEALKGIQQIKFSASESKWDEVIMAIRKQEYDAGWVANAWIIPLFIVWRAMPILMGGVALTVFTLLRNQMAASVIFAALTIFSSLEHALAGFPMSLGALVDALVSIKRIEEHLRSDDKAEILSAGTTTIEFRNATIAWPSNQDSTPTPVLKGVSLQFPPRELSIIGGKTGSGKSLLLTSIIGEAEILSGTVDVPRLRPLENHTQPAPPAGEVKHSQMAFVSQVPWLENASLKDNILFGKAYDHDRYTEVLHACALQQDISTLQDGDRTEIGASGINLSGGQKWRVTLARALYSQAGILILDDIFSAVDAHVGRHLLTHALLGRLAKNRTIIIATHHIGLLEQYARYRVQLEDGQAFGRTMTNTLTPALHADSGTASQTTRPDERKAPEARKFIEDEFRQQGRVPLSVYRSYLAFGGSWLQYGGIVLLFILSAVTTLARSYWVAVWTSQYQTHTQLLSDHPSERNTSHPNWRMYLGVYGALSLLPVLLLCIQFWTVSLATLGAASKMFRSATHHVLRAPLRWSATQPLGRVLNRFVGDFTVLDTRVGVDIAWFVGGVFSTLIVMVSALFVSRWMLIPVLAITATCVYVTSLYLDAARDLRRLESIAKSPMYDLVDSALAGLATVRAFGRADDYMERMHEHIDGYAQTTWHLVLATCWVRFRQGLLGVVLVLCVAVAVVRLDELSASLAGFALSFALQFTDFVETTARQATEMEMDLNYAERVLEYGDLETEPSSGDEAPPTWPSNGKIDFQDVEVGYADHLPAVLKQISFVAQPHQRIGIVGRTGSGKSSLTHALFRILELRSGRIEIDGIDIAVIKLYDLRSRMTIIPQDPVLFSGTLRSNLDPFDDFDDETLLQAMRRVHLLDSPFDGNASVPDPAKKHMKSRVFSNLSFPISSSGSNLSQGQKQLLCLARALITRPRILILDEATSAVDSATDLVIQQAIREEFPETTLLVIAHRLSTISDFDKVLVLDHGNVIEFDEPSVLLQKENGVFRGMLEKSGQ